jgi:hypothetical protein
MHLCLYFFNEKSTPGWLLYGMIYASNNATSIFASIRMYFTTDAFSEKSSLFWGVLLE